MATVEKQEQVGAATPPDLDIDGVTRRSTLKWMTLAWVGFAAATVAGLTASMRFMFPNVLFEPPTRFKAGDPSTYSRRRSVAIRRWVAASEPRITEARTSARACASSSAR